MILWHDIKILIIISPPPILSNWINKIKHKVVVNLYKFQVQKAFI
jgi:hypothetical protein